VDGVSTDTRTLKPSEAFLALRGDNFDGHDFILQAIKKGASCVICEKPLTGGDKARKTPLVIVKDTQKALGDLARFQRNKFSIPVIAVTGSNGKTTAKEMIACVLGTRYKVLKSEGTRNNQIGLPLALLKLKKTDELAVLEIGTSHFGEVEYLAQTCRPNLGVITNIGPAHLQHFKTLNGVLKEKSALLKGLLSPQIAVLNTDDPFLAKEAARKKFRPFVVGFGLKNQSDFFAHKIRLAKGSLEFLVNAKNQFNLKTPGCYNVYNALAAAAVGRLFGLEYRQIISALSGFNFPRSRLNFLTLNRVRFIDDTYNSNPLSLEAALNTLEDMQIKGRKILVMGDMLELGAQAAFLHRQAGRLAARACDTFITVGSLSKLAAQSARDCGFRKGSIFSCDSCAQARELLYKEILPRKDDIVLVKGSRRMKMEEMFK
jgi:UDP-N-acetylmuramoyl-tripeptide--D-alanyl-D-alanine ligase